MPKETTTSRGGAPGSSRQSPTASSRTYRSSAVMRPSASSRGPFSAASPPAQTSSNPRAAQALSIGPEVGEGEGDGVEGRHAHLLIVRERRGLVQAPAVAPGMRVHRRFA